MNLQSRKLEDDLVDAIESINEHQFRYMLENLCINPDKPLSCFDGLSVFEKVLLTPNFDNFIKICLQNGSDFYRKNSDGFYPLRFAIESSSAGNIKTILKIVDESAVNREDVNSDIQYLMIVNQKLEGGNNFLHFLINQIDDKMEADVSKAVKLLLVNGCNPNTQNDRLETPFYLLLNTPKLSKTRRDLIDYFIKHSTIDFHSHDDIITLMVKHGVNDAVTFAKPVKDVNYMLQLIVQYNELKFVEEFKTFINFHGDALKLLEEAILRNLWRIVEVIVNNGIDLNRSLSFLKLSPAFLACNFGHHQSLKVLLSDGKLRLKNEKQNILHHLLEIENIDANDRQKCFDLIVGDRRCNNDVINGFDAKNQPPLFYACHYGYHEIVKELLQRGAFIGHESVINNIDKDDLNEFLDENVKFSGDVRDKNCEVQVDYKFLMDEKSDKEIRPLHLMTENQNLNELILHPVILSFLDIKWKKIDFIVYLNLAIYFCFMIFLGCFVINYFHDGIYNNYGIVIPEGGIHSKPSNAMSDVPQTTKSPPRFTDDNDDDQLLKTIFSSNFPNPPLASDVPHLPPVIPHAATHPNPITPPPIQEKPANSVPNSNNFKKPNLISLLFGFGDDKTRTKRSIDGEHNEKWDQKFQNHFQSNLSAYRFCVFGVFLMMVYEILQFASSYKTYFFKLSNWLDISLIWLSYIVLLGSFVFQAEDFKKIRALMILIMAAQTIQLVASVSFLSMSLHMAIFKKVCKTFLKTIALYLILILAFAMSFYTLNDKSGERNSNSQHDQEGEMFSDPFMSVITTVRMMLSDFENVKIDSKDHFQGAMFLLFVILITVILFNLLNALAISDTHEIIKDAELVDTKKRISILNSYEKIFNYLNLNFVNIFPEMQRIVITPNKDQTVKLKQISVDSSENVVVSIHKTCKFQKLSSFTAKHKKFWLRGSKSVKLDRKIIEKIQNLAK